MSGVKGHSLIPFVGLGVVGVAIVLSLAFISANFRSQTSPSESAAEIPAKLQTRYQDYSPAVSASAADKKRVLFFYAPWCPTCRPADAAFRDTTDQIPEDIVLFRVNYDTETELKRQYGITYQHTFVFIDEKGDVIRKWNGGQLPELISNTRS